MFGVLWSVEQKHERHIETVYPLLKKTIPIFSVRQESKNLVTYQPVEGNSPWSALLYAMWAWSCMVMTDVVF
jgi:hypothetical protein